MTRPSSMPPFAEMPDPELAEDQFVEWFNTRMMPECARHLGTHLEAYSVSGGWARLSFSPKIEFCNPNGSLHGGFLCAMLDNTFSTAVWVKLKLARLVPTLQMSVSFVEPAPFGKLTGLGHVTRLGKSVASLTAELRSADGVLVAESVATASVIDWPSVG